jgi:hypothetical protein
MERAVLILLAVVSILAIGQGAHRLCVLTHPDAPRQCEFPGTYPD